MKPKENVSKIPRKLEVTKIEYNAEPLTEIQQGMILNIDNVLDDEKMKINKGTEEFKKIMEKYNTNVSLRDFLEKDPEIMKEAYLLLNNIINLNGYFKSMDLFFLQLNKFKNLKFDSLVDFKEMVVVMNDIAKDGDEDEILINKMIQYYESVNDPKRFYDFNLRSYNIPVNLIEDVKNEYKKNIEEKGIGYVSGEWFNLDGVKLSVMGGTPYTLYKFKKINLVRNSMGNLPKPGEFFYHHGVIQYCDYAGRQFAGKGTKENFENLKQANYKQVDGGHVEMYTAQPIDFTNRVEWNKVKGEAEYDSAEIEKITNLQESIKKERGITFNGDVRKSLGEIIFTEAKDVNDMDLFLDFFLKPYYNKEISGKQLQKILLNFKTFKKERDKFIHDEGIHSVILYNEYDIKKVNEKLKILFNIYYKKLGKKSADILSKALNSNIKKNSSIDDRLEAIDFIIGDIDFYL